MSSADFHNRLRILLNLDRHDLEEAGVLKAGREGWSEWIEFRRDPFRACLRMDDERYALLWGLMDRRARA